MKSYSFKSPYSAVFEAAKKALSNLSMNIQEVDVRRGTIIASTKTSFLSWGEDISVVFKETMGSTKVEVESTSPSQLISWGKNTENEHNIINEIKINLQN